MLVRAILLLNQFGWCCALRGITQGFFAAPASFLSQSPGETRRIFSPTTKIEEEPTGSGAKTSPLLESGIASGTTVAPTMPMTTKRKKPKNGSRAEPPLVAERQSRKEYALSERKKAKGSLIIIGGREDKDDECRILQEVVKRLHGVRNRLVVATIATEYPEEMFEQYRKAFNKLGVKHVDLLDARTREDGMREEHIKLVDAASVIFFTGGDQLRITSQIGDTPVFQHMALFYREGGTIVGTSAGAAAMSETMLFSGPSDETNKLSALGMAPGLGLVKGLVIDTHFAERGRMGRLLGAVAQNPRTLGLGIDENTAVIVEHEDSLRVIGSGAVYVVDGSPVSYSSLSEKEAEGITSVHDVKLHVLGEGGQFDLLTRRPSPPPDSVLYNANGNSNVSKK